MAATQYTDTGVTSVNINPTGNVITGATINGRELTLQGKNTQLTSSVNASGTLTLSDGISSANVNFKSNNLTISGSNSDINIMVSYLTTTEIDTICDDILK